MNDKQIGRPIDRDLATFRSISRKINSSMGVKYQVSRTQPSAGIKAGFQWDSVESTGFWHWRSLSSSSLCDLEQVLHQSEPYFPIYKINPTVLIIIAGLLKGPKYVVHYVEHTKCLKIVVVHSIINEGADNISRAKLLEDLSKHRCRP